jgi:cbb3-type cytochrome oxidase maturation protein
MEVLVYLVPLALLLGLLGLGGFLWSLRSGQYDDLEGAAWRAILDDDPPADQNSRESMIPKAPAQTAAGTKDPVV